MICTCLLKFPVYVTNILLFFTCTKIFLSSADVTSCDFDYLENHEVDLSAIADEGKAVILAEKTARDMNDCSELCCGIYEDSYANNKVGPITNTSTLEHQTTALVAFEERKATTVFEAIERLP